MSLLKHTRKIHEQFLIAPIWCTLRSHMKLTALRTNRDLFCQFSESMRIYMLFEQMNGYELRKLPMWGTLCINQISVSLKQERFLGKDYFLHDAEAATT